MSGMFRDDILDRLHSLDEYVFLSSAPEERQHIILVGGGALVLMECISRSTYDIDAIEAPKELQGLLAKFDINCRVQTYVNNFPYNYEDRVSKIPIDTKAIDFYTASLEDIVIAKLYSYRDSDYHDITSPEVLNKLDWDLLHSIAVSGETRDSALNDARYQEFLASYSEYERRFRPCAH